jgi:hypothetical protein
VHVGHGRDVPEHEGQPRDVPQLGERLLLDRDVPLGGGRPELDRRPPFHLDANRAPLAEEPYAPVARVTGKVSGYCWKLTILPGSMAPSTVGTSPRPKAA